MICSANYCQTLSRGNKIFYVFLTFLLLWGGQFTALAQGKVGHACAETKIRTGSRLLADGVTSEAHRALMRQYDLHWYSLDLQLENNSLRVAGNVRMYVTSLVEGLADFAFELHQNHAIRQVLVNGTPSMVRRSGGEVIVTMPAPVSRQEKFMVQIFYEGISPSGAGAAIGNGFNVGTSPFGGQYAWSLSQPFAAYEWFPCKQLLRDKADSVQVWVTTSTQNKVGSNGLLQRVTPLPDQKHRYEWRSTYPIAYYLISVAVGQYQEYSFNVQLSGAPSPMLVQNYLYEGPQVLNAYKEGVDRTGPFLVTFSELFGVYPFYREKYGHSMAPLGGGMEHQTMTTQLNFDFTLTAHELGHQWWGDEVTCADWSHIWLNEGFATYCEYLAIENLLPAEKMNWLRRASASALNYPQGSVFVRDSTNVERIFNSGLTYRKGALVLHMLRNTLDNDALFFNILQAYREQYRFDVATTRDFQRVVEEEAGKSFDYFFDQWIYGEGYPLFQISWAQQGEELYLQSSQKGSSSATPFFKTEVDLLVTTSSGATVITLQQNQPVERLLTNVTGTVQSIEVDPYHRLLEITLSVLNEPELVQSFQEVLVYPNPTLGNVALLGGPGIPSEVVVFDEIGQKIMHLVPQSMTLPVAGLRPGVYILRLRYGQQVVFKRFVKL